MGTVYLIVIDGLGAGAQEDSHLYGDEGCNTLAHVSEVTGCRLPNLEKMGLGNIIPLKSISPAPEPVASYGKMREVSPGKDSITGHWEMAGIKIDQPFPIYRNGFPDEVINKFLQITGTSGVLVNKPISGLDAIEEYGEEHMQSGKPIVYTSSDSVFQVACHEDVVSVEMQCIWCKLARAQVFIGEHAVGRVIARPFSGKKGSFYRLTDHRHDFSVEPPKPFLQQYLNDNDIVTYSIGKVIDLFAKQGFSHFRRTKSNAEGISHLLNLMSASPEGFVFVNLVDTDQLFGHRNDPAGFAESLRNFDRAVPAILSKLNHDNALIITGDHGNDPTTPGTDHSREFVPLLVIDPGRKKSSNLGTRESFRDIASSVCSYFNLNDVFDGNSFFEDM